MDTQVISGNPDQVVRAQTALLEDLFTRVWLEDPRNSGHPAAIRHSVCRTIARQNGWIHLPDQQAFVPELAPMLLDTINFIEITQGDVSQFRMGDLAGYGDAAVQSKIRSRVRKADAFRDLMVELVQSAWNTANGHSVTPLERPGWPDLRILMAGVRDPAYVECKKLNSPSSNRIRSNIRNANRQLRAVTEPSFGIMVMDISAAIPSEYVPKDGDPNFAVPIVDRVGDALSSNKSRSVCRVILTWDEYIQKGNPEEKALLFVRRRFINIEHELVSGVRPIPANARTFTGSTVMVAFSSERVKSSGSSQASANST